MNIDQEQNFIKAWMATAENIFACSQLFYPNRIQQTYISNFIILQGIYREYNSQKDLQKSISVKFPDSKSFLQGAIYFMYQCQNQKEIFNVIKMNGLRDIKLFHEEFISFTSSFYHLLKVDAQRRIFTIMDLLLECNFEQLEYCYTVFLRVFNIYNNNYIEFLTYNFKNFPQIYESEQLSILLFQKFLLFLNIPELYTIQDSPIKIIAGYMEKLWQKHQSSIIQYGKELLINIQVPLHQSETYNTLKSIKDSIMSQNMILLYNTKLNSTCYKNNYLLGLTYDQLDKFLFAVFQQIRPESTKAQLAMFFEIHGYNIHFIGQIVRYLINLVEFEDQDQNYQYRIAEAFIIIYELAEFEADKWSIYLKYIFVDLFFFIKEQDSDHVIQPSAFFLKALYNHKMYEELNSCLYFILYTAEKNELTKGRLQDSLQILNKYQSLHRFINDPNVNDLIKQKLSEVCYLQQEPSHEPEHAPQRTREYQIQMEVEAYEPILTNVDSDFPTMEEEVEESLSYLQVSLILGTLLKREQLDQLLKNPQNKQLLLKFYDMISRKTLSIDVRESFLSEVADLLIVIYEDHFYDFDFEYEFNAILLLIEQESDTLKDLFDIFVIKDQNCLTLMILAYFEKRTAQLPLKYLQNITTHLDSLKLILEPARFNSLIKEILQYYNHLISMKSIIYIISILSNQDLESLQEIIEQNINITDLSELISQLNHLDESKKSKIINLIFTYLNKVKTEQIFDIMKTALSKATLTFWKHFNPFFIYCIRTNKLSDDNIVQLIIMAMQYLELQSEGVTELCILIPNTSKKLVIQAAKLFIQQPGATLMNLILRLQAADNGLNLAIQLRAIDPKLN